MVQAKNVIEDMRSCDTFPQNNCIYPYYAYVLFRDSAICVSAKWEDTLTMMVMAGVRTDAHYLQKPGGDRIRVTDCLLGQLKRILDISDSDAGLKGKKWKVQPI